MADLDTPTDDGLTAQQRRFALEYLKDCNGKQAAIRAGYSERSAETQASRLLRNGKVAAFVRQGLAKVERKALVDAEYVIRSLRNVAERCQQAVPVMEFDREAKAMVQVRDEKTGEGLWEFDSSGANKALELLGKHLKLFTDKVEATGKDGAPLELVIRDLAKEET